MTLGTELLGLAADIVITILANVIAPEKCCGDLGCFPLGYPWTTINRPLPLLRCAEECPVAFHMFFRQNVSDMYTVTWPPTSLNSTPYDGRKPTVLYVGGYHNNIQDQWNVELRNWYIYRRDVNFIYYGWEVCKYDWRTSLASLRVFAAQAARFMRYLIQHHGADPSRFHIIGHSWGAHLAAYISRRIKGTRRLTGLDPAFFYFWSNSNEVQIGSADAEFVEIGHTDNFPIFVLGGIGILEPRGHVDYYFNGNWIQPGCILDAGQQYLKTLQKNGTFNLLTFIINVVGCGHIESLYYYIDGLKEANCTIWGERMNSTVNIFNAITSGRFAENTTTLEHCDIESCSPWGLEAIKYPARGVFSVATTDKRPYCTPNPQLDKKMAKQLEEYKRDFFKYYNVNNLLR